MKLPESTVLRSTLWSHERANTAFVEMTARFCAKKATVGKMKASEETESWLVFSIKVDKQTADQMHFPQLNRIFGACWIGPDEIDLSLMHTGPSIISLSHEASRFKRNDPSCRDSFGSKPFDITLGPARSAHRDCGHNVLIDTSNSNGCRNGCKRQDFPAHPGTC